MCESGEVCTYKEHLRAVRGGKGYGRKFECTGHHLILTTKSCFRLHPNQYVGDYPSKVPQDINGRVTLPLLPAPPSQATAVSLGDESHRRGEGGKVEEGLLIAVGAVYTVL